MQLTKSFALLPATSSIGFCFFQDRWATIKVIPLQFHAVQLKLFDLQGAPDTIYVTQCRNPAVNHLKKSNLLIEPLTRIHTQISALYKQLLYAIASPLHPPLAFIQLCYSVLHPCLMQLIPAHIPPPFSFSLSFYPSSLAFVRRRGEGICVFN